MSTPAAATPAAATPAQHHGPEQSLLPLSLAALGIVFGDIGTSPLYAIKECFHGIHAIEANPTNVFGVLSLMFWSLMVVVSVKYIMFILRADNRGEGGMFALLALVTARDMKLAERTRWIAVFLALFGAALLYGEGVITPAISVLSAIEGLKVATHAAEPVVVPLTCLILAGLFGI